MHQKHVFAALLSDGSLGEHVRGFTSSFTSQSVLAHPRARFDLTVYLAVAMFALSASLATRAEAQENDVVAAANAFAQAQRAELAGENARAAELYEVADHIAPTPEALRNATRARYNAHQLVAAATDAEELLRRYGDDHTSRELADHVLNSARPALVRYRVHCSGPCTLIVNGYATGTPAAAEQVLYVEPGDSEVVARFERGSSDSTRLQAKAGEQYDLNLAPTPASIARAEEQAAIAASPPSAVQGVPSHESNGVHKLSPIIFWSVAGATVVLGAVTIWSTIDLNKARDDFKKDPTPTLSEFQAGEKKDTRTTALLITTAVLAASATTLAFFTKWHKHDVRTAVASDGRSAALVVRGSY